MNKEISNKISTIYSERQPKFALTYLVETSGTSLQNLHNQIKNRLGITLPKVSNKSYITHSIAKDFFKFKFDKKKIAFQIVKGGTGKTTAVHNISCAASLYGAKILAIDIDPQGNLTDAFSVDPDNVPVLIDIIADGARVEDSIINVEEGIDLLPSRIENVILDGNLAMNKIALHRLFDNILSPIEKNYDFIFIDCPPMMGHSVTAATLYVDTVVVPLNPDKFSLKGLNIIKNEIANINKGYDKNIEYKVFLNKYNGNTILSDKVIQTTIADEFIEGHALNVAIRQTQDIPNAIDSELNLFSSLRTSSVKQDFDILTRELLNIKISKQKSKK